MGRVGGGGFAGPLHSLFRKYNYISVYLFQLTTMLHPLKHLFTPHNVPLTMKMLTQLLKPKFSPDGANRLVRESLVYTKFLRYLRETASKLASSAYPTMILVLLCLDKTRNFE